MSNNNLQKTSKFKIAKIIFVIIFAVATIGFFMFIPFLDAELTETEENVMFFLMFLDVGVWVVSLFGFLFTILLQDIKKINPQLYAKLASFDKGKNFFKNLWDNMFVMIIVSIILLIGFTIVFSLLKAQLIWIILLIISIIISVIIALCTGWKRLGKVLFITILICALITSSVPLIQGIFGGISGGDNSNNDKCGVCDGSGMVPNEEFGFSKCPYCKGTGIPPL